MPSELWLFVAAGVAGGVVNAAAGGAKLFVFPLLLASGLPPLVANATGSVALWPSQAPAAWVYRDVLLDDARGLLRRMLPGLLGAVLGAIALVFSSERAFTATIPLLLAISVGAILLGPRLADVLRRAVSPERLRTLVDLLIFATGFYGGYFGAGIGFMLLAVLGVAGVADLQRANAVKILFVFCINSGAVVPLALSGLVDWLAAIGVLLGGLLGGYLGARVARRLPERPMRWAVAVLGVVLTASFLIG